MVRIAYKSSVAGDLKHLDKGRATSLIEQLEDSLNQSPDVGEPLKGEFRGLYKLRLGDYRVMYTKTQEGILVLRIDQGSKVYGK